MRCTFRMAVMLSILSGAAASSAVAQRPPGECDGDVAEWVSETREQTGLEVVTQRCDEAVVVLRLRTEVLVADVEIRRADSGGFRRAGRYGVSPILEVEDYSALPVAFRDAFDELVSWVAGDGQGGLNAITTPRPSAERLGVASPVPPLRVLLALVFCVLGLRRARGAPMSRPSGVHRSGLLALFAGALVLRVLLSPWELYRAGQGPLWIGSLYGHTELGTRPGYGELYGSVAHLAGTHVETAVFAVNALSSAVTVVMTAMAVRALGASRKATAFVGLALLADPISIRMSASESYFVPIAFLVACAVLIALAASARLDHEKRLHGALLMAAAALLVEQAARIHPAAWPALAGVPLVLLATPLPWQTRLRRTALLAAFVAFALAHSFGVLRAMIAEALEATGEPDMPMLAVGAVVLLLLLVLTPPRHRRVFLFAAPALFLTAWARMAYDPVPDLRLGLDRTGALFALLVIAFAVPERLRGSPVVAMAALGLLMINAAWSWNPATRLDTTAQENRVVRRMLDGIDPDCRFLHAGAEPMLPLYHGRQLGERPRGRWLDDDAGSLAASGVFTCAYYYRGSFCATSTGEPVCRSVEEGSQLRIVESARLEARSPSLAVSYPTPEVVVELFEVFEVLH